MVTDVMPQERINKVPQGKGKSPAGLGAMSEILEAEPVGDTLSEMSADDQDMVCTLVKGEAFPVGCRCITHRGNSGGVAWVGAGRAEWNVPGQFVWGVV